MRHLPVPCQKRASPFYSVGRLLPATICLLGACLAVEITPAAQNDSERMEREVGHLLDYLGKSGCQFYRNGDWFDPGKAREHLLKKYHYLRKKSLVHSAEEFIDLGASSSSRSGEPYRVRCGSSAAQPSATWLGAELARLRAKAGGAR